LLFFFFFDPQALPFFFADPLDITILVPLPFALQIEPITAILSVSEQENTCETMLCGKFRIGCLVAQRGKE
jgi:hypothetical protein